MKMNVEKWVLHYTAYDSGGIPVAEHVVPTPIEVDVAAVTRAGKCYRCGGRGHIARDCPAEEEETNGGGGDHCDFCGGTSHAESECWERREVQAHKRVQERKAKGKGKGKGKSKSKQKGMVHEVAEEPQPTPELNAQVGTVHSAAAPRSGLSEEELYKMCRPSADPWTF
ncbi:unnamed protein product [Polarella glacialis]|uniref:CCHC-type domain-containing protein n=1 Tax=Polarella glacialis TaxID=89957 RepID=A0A813GY78_POLGL|nr:unnamed protein product [Polarella glacialis]CAE8742619.1 unnamed protein product [Polarella glacialis]